MLLRGKMLNGIKKKHKVFCVVTITIDKPRVETVMALNCLPAIRHYLRNASFHAHHYLPSHLLHPTERIFWLVCSMLAWLATIFLIQSAYSDFQTNAITFAVDTSYLGWSTNFPSIAVCETDNQPNIANVTDRTYGDPHDYNLDEVVKELVYFRGLSFYTLQICGREAHVANANCFRMNFSDFSRMVRGKCPDIFQKCAWNDKEFECCRYFGEIRSEMGVCFVINSMQTKRERFEMVSNQKMGAGRLYLELRGYANLYILGEQEVPSMTTLATDVIQVAPHIHYHRYFSLKEVENEPEVKDVSVTQRKCKFTDESDGLDVYNYYSYSSCCVQCRKNAQLRTCHCAHHLIPNTRPELFCNITGLECLSKNYEKLSVLKPYWAPRIGLVCDCLPSCTEIELSIIKEDKFGISDDFSIVELSLERLPSERYKRNVVRGKLDLVVSMGGSTALFLGASILSFVEVFYYFFVKPISNYFIKMNNYRENRRFRVNIR